MKYKVGDKVRVRKDLGVGECYGSMIFLRGMDAYRGKVVTIDRVEAIPRVYGIDGYKDTFWTDEMFDGLAEKTPIKFRVGDRVRRIHHDNNWCDGTELKVGEIVTVVKINSKDDISVDINGKIKAGNDPEHFELVKEEATPITPVININVTINNYDNACWYCRKGGLVDLYLDGAMGICPNCKRVCNDTRGKGFTLTNTRSAIIEFKAPKRKNEPLTTEELEALPDGTKVFTLWLNGETEDWSDSRTCWRKKKGSKLVRENGHFTTIDWNGKSNRAYLEEPERPIPEPDWELPF